MKKKNKEKVITVTSRPVICPMCGTACVIVGDMKEGTMYYEPIKKGKNEK